MPAENVPAIQIAVGLLAESDAPEIVADRVVDHALATLAEGIDAPRPSLDASPAERPMPAIASASGSEVSPSVDALVDELGLESHDRATIRALLSAGLDEEAIRDLAAAVLEALPEEPSLALAVFRAFGHRLGYGTAPGVRPRLSRESATLLGEIAGQTAAELRRTLSEPAAAEIATATAWPLSQLPPELIVSSPVAMVELLSTSQEAGPARAIAVTMAAPEWLPTHMSREEQVRARIVAGELVESVMGKLAAHERGYAEGAVIAVSSRYGVDAARALLAAYAQVVGDAAGLVLATAMAETNERDDRRRDLSREQKLEVLAELVLELDAQLDRAADVLGPIGSTLPARAHLASHAAEQLVASGSTQAFLLVLQLLRRNTRLTPRERIRRLAQLPRSLSASGDPEALERWVLGNRRPPPALRVV